MKNEEWYCRNKEQAANLLQHSLFANCENKEQNLMKSLWSLCVTGMFYNKESIGLLLSYKIKYNICL